MDTRPPSPRSLVVEFERSNSPYRPYPPQLTLDSWGTSSAIPTTPPCSPVHPPPNSAKVPRIDMWQVIVASDKLWAREREQETQDPWYSSGVVDDAHPTPTRDIALEEYLSTLPRHVSPNTTFPVPINATTIRFLQPQDTSLSNWFVPPTDLEHSFETAALSLGEISDSDMSSDSDQQWFGHPNDYDTCRIPAHPPRARQALLNCFRSRPITTMAMAEAEDNPSVTESGEKGDSKSATESSEGEGEGEGEGESGEGQGDQESDECDIIPAPSTGRKRQRTAGAPSIKRRRMNIRVAIHECNIEHESDSDIEHESDNEEPSTEPSTLTPASDQAGSSRNSADDAVVGLLQELGEHYERGGEEEARAIKRFRVSMAYVQENVERQQQYETTGELPPSNFYYGPSTP